MNHDAARQKESDKLWHYTRHNKRTGTYPIGYCGEYQNCECTQPHGILTKNTLTCEKCGGTGAVKNLSPCPGHATAEEACEHYKQYLLDGATFHDDSADPQTLHRCEFPDCRNMTDGSARVPGGMISRTLCKEHRNRDSLAKLISVGESWHS